MRSNSYDYDTNINFNQDTKSNPNKKKYFKKNDNNGGWGYFFKKIDFWIYNYFFSTSNKRKTPQVITSTTYLLLVCISSLITFFSLVVPLEDKTPIDIIFKPYYYFLICFFAFDWLIRTHYSKYSISAKNIFLKWFKYQLRLSTMIDLISWSVPMVLIIYFNINEDLFLLVPIFLILKVFSFFRIFASINKNENLKILSIVFKKSLKLILVLVLSMAIFDLIFAIFLFNFELITPPLEPGKTPSIQTYFDSIWFCFITITTIGYGDIVPVTAAGRVLTIMLTILGVGFYSFLASIIVNGFTRYLDEVKKKKEEKQINTQKNILEQYKKEIYKKIDSLNKIENVNKDKIDNVEKIENLNKDKIDNVEKIEKNISHKIIDNRPIKQKKVKKNKLKHNKK